MSQSSRGAKLLILGITFFLGLCITSASSPILSAIFGAETISMLLSQSAIQAIFAFILPAWLTFKLCSPTPFQALGLKRGYSPVALCLTIGIMGVAIPFLNEVIVLNESMHFPNGLETIFRESESQAAELTKKMLSSSSIGGLLAEVIFIGIVTGFSEELFFRGALQKILIGKYIGVQGAIWLAAIIFSLLHFQPYGFVPRVLLGAFFGYLYYWSGSLWLSATAHAFNNSMVVVMTWLSLRGVDSKAMESLGTEADGSLWVGGISAVVTIFLIVTAYKYLSHKKQITDSRPPSL